MHRSVRTLLAMAALGLAGSSLPAQNVPFLAKGNLELNGFAGVSTGFGGVHGSYGGNFAVAVTRYIMPYAEYSYFPKTLGLTQQDTVVAGVTGVVATAPTRRSLQDIHGGVHIRIPVGDSKVVPYLAFGLGDLHVSGTSNVPLSIPQPSGIPLIVPVSFPSQNEFAVNFGGGIRIYTKENFGIRFEVKGYKPASGPYTDTFMKASVGFFYYAKK